MNYKSLLAPLVYCAGCLAAAYILDLQGYPDHAQFAKDLLAKGGSGFFSRLLFNVN